MFLRIYLDHLSANDSDYLLREFSKLGAEAKIAFSVGEDHSLLVKQRGSAEDILKTVSVATQEEYFRVEITS